jgi:hypothetical protein
MPEYTAAPQRWVAPQRKDWFGYKFSEESAQAAVAASLSKRRGMDFAPEDMALTTGR